MLPGTGCGSVISTLERCVEGRTLNEAIQPTAFPDLLSRLQLC